MSVRLRKQKTIPLLFVSFSGPDCGCVVLCCAVPLSGNFFFLIKMHSYQLVCGIFILVLINNFLFPFLFTLKKNSNNF